MSRFWTCAVLVAPLLGACATDGGTGKPTHTVEAVAKVVDSLAEETVRRIAIDPYRGLAVVIDGTAVSGNATETIVGEFLRTRLLERGIAVHASCGARCLAVSLQEFATSAPGISQFTPGQILTVATGGVPVLGTLTRNLGEREQEAARAAARTTGLLVTFAAREGERFMARSHVVAIVSASSGDVALEQK